MKQFFRSRPVQACLTWLIANYMILVRRTTRWTVLGDEYVRPVWEGGKGLVWCYWHSRIIGSHAVWPRDQQPVLMLVSLSPDGQFVADTGPILGRGVVRGSTPKKRDGIVDQKGATDAFRQMVAHAKNGGCVGITPDGPSGPRMRAQPGAVRVAKAAGVPMLPSAYAIKGSRHANSWDRFLIPPLFGRGVIAFGEPVIIPKGADAAALEEARVTIEQRLNEVTQQADEAVGLSPTEPEALKPTASSEIS